MFLLYGVIVLSITFLWWSLAMVSCRNPRPRWYGGETMQSYIWAPLGAVGLVLGILLARKSLPHFPPSILEVVSVLAVIAGTLALHRMLKFKQRLAAYTAAEVKEGRAGEDGSGDSPNDVDPAPVGRPPSSPVGLQKAA